ncbi:response regulator transcription factor [Micromonospora sp. ALFpr18c]|uniref:response regulator transcription factor n=1 Tax=Micromonospora sp. ALFpr18c TaxID=1458665 RepID=UPI00124B54C9|nr:response regulator transcription factor [Micromonospora sp. ALFpr18c]KAB1930741.1 response regulator transcription factor [Micromonospora sp. ALFpr18c]
MIKVLIADDQAMVRQGFGALLAAQPDLLVVGDAADGAQAVAAARRLDPDVVLMDVRMPVMDGLEATRKLLGDRSAQRPRVLILTTFDLDDYVYEALRAGASGFLLKDAPAADLVQAVRVVAEQTVKTHVGRILAKLGLRDRAQAVVLAYETGLVAAGE